MTICPPATTVTRDTTAHKEECMKTNACIVNWMTNQYPINLFCFNWLLGSELGIKSVSSCFVVCAQLTGYLEAYKGF